MAGDWLKVEKDTPEKPEVLALSSTLGISPDDAFGKCFKFWRWADSHLVDGNAARVTESVVDALVGIPGFAHALIEVGWLQARNGSLVVPNFDRHMSQSAKRRALTAKRVSQHKQRSTNAPLTLDALPREEKRREEKKKEETPLPPLLQTPEFLSAWEDWQRHRKEIKHPLKPTMASGQLAMLAELGPERAVATIRHTIMKGWQGLREPEEPPSTVPGPGLPMLKAPPRRQP